jgi:hypothetical protein
MNIKEFIKMRKMALIIILVVSAAVTGLFFKSVGIKDSVMVFAATFLLLLEICFSGFA